MTTRYALTAHIFNSFRDIPVKRIMLRSNEPIPVKRIILRSNEPIQNTFSNVTISWNIYVHWQRHSCSGSYINSALLYTLIILLHFILLFRQIIIKGHEKHFENCKVDKFLSRSHAKSYKGDNALHTPSLCSTNSMASDYMKLLLLVIITINKQEGNPRSCISHLQRTEIYVY